MEEECFKKKQGTESGNLGRESRKSAEVCYMVSVRIEVDSMNELVDFLEEKIQNLDLSWRNIQK